MTTDDKTPDPTPALLPPSRLAAIRALALAAPPSLYAEPDPGATCDECEEHMAGEGAAILRTPGGGGALIVLSGDRDAEAVAFHREAREVVMELLAHLDALTPFAAPDGEALGLAIFAASDMQAGESAENTAAEWVRLLSGDRAEMARQGTTLHAIGYAAGRSEGEAERARLLSELADLRAKGEADREVSNYREAEIARLTVERDALAAELARWCKGAGVTSPDALASLLRDNLRAIDAARVEGARAEREAVDLYLLAAYQETGYEGPVASALSDALDWLRARGAGGAR